MNEDNPGSAMHPKTSLYEAVQRYVNLLRQQEVPVLDGPLSSKGKVTVYVAETRDRKIFYIYQPLKDNKAKELVVVTGNEDADLKSIIKETERFPDRQPVDSMQDSIDEAAVGSYVSQLSALYNGWSGAAVPVQTEEYSVRVEVESNPLEEKIGRGGIVRKVPLVLASNFATQNGETFTPSKIESIIMHTLVSNLEELKSFGFDRLFSIQASAIFDMGTQEELWPYLTATPRDIDEGERMFLAARAREIFGENIALEDLETMLGAGPTYVQMEQYCKDKADKILIYELDNNVSVESVFQEIFTDKFIAVHTEFDDNVIALAEHAVNNRGSISLEQLTNVENFYIFNNGKAVRFVGNTARNAFTAYAANAAENIRQEQLRQEEIRQEQIRQEQLRQEEIRQASRPANGRRRTGTVAYGIRILQPPETPATQEFDDKPTTLNGVAPVYDDSPVPERIPLDEENDPRRNR